HSEMAVGLFEWEQLRRRMVRPFFAEGRIGRRTDSRSEPDAALFIEHRVVHAGLAISDDLVGPVWRRCHGILRRCRGLWVAGRHVDLTRLMSHRVQDRYEICALLGSPIDEAVGVDRGMALVGGDLVVQVGLGTGPVPYGDDDVALHALWPRRLRRGQFASS